MSGFSRKIGIVGFVLSVGVACTQLFGGDRQNTLAGSPGAAGKASISTSPVLPTPPGEMAVCETGQVRCDGALLQTCADDRTSWVTLQRCAAAALCQSSPAACLAATCSADEMTCSGSVLQRCNETRTGWDVFATCLSPAHCNADQRQCRTEPCNPGDRRCDRSETDQSPVLEVCRDDRTDWGPLDACVTRELCDQTLTSAAPGGLVLGSDGMVQVQAPSSPQTVLSCNLPACAVGEVRCDGARLEFCSEGRTGWVSAEECASAALCAGSLGNVGSAGVAQCLTPVCATGQHQCTDLGMLQLCSEDRTGFRDLELCIGPPFCNALLADQGQAGCQSAPCEAGQVQCNGAQIQVCRDDRTGLDNLGEPCESAALCNVADPLNAVCDEPACRRGATSGNEFRCEGAELQRCNESLTFYDTVQTCVTAALCDASQRANGCKPPVCRPNQHACNNGFLQTCNADQTGFDNTENCGSQAQCDVNAGRCADPCEPGATRCNSASGDLEQCRDRLTGWRPIADCQSLALCDADNGRCNICLSGQFSCADNQLRQCATDGRTFSRQNIPAECATAPGGGAGVRACQNNQVVVNPCPFGCSNGRCNECQGSATQCVGNGQIRRCVNGFFGAPSSCSDGNACNGVESCQNNNCVGGTAPNCNDGNQCTSDSCNTTRGCQSAGFSSNFQCINNGSQAQGCNNGLLQTANCTANLGCTGGRCNNCNQGACANGTQFQTCDNGQLSAAKNCPANNLCQGAGNCAFNCQQLDCNDNNACTNDSCSPQAGCQHGAVANRAQCVNGDIQSCTNGNASSQDCGAAGCNTGSTSCNACAANTAPTCLANGQRRTCVNGQFQNAACPAGQGCQGGNCVNNQVCTPGRFVSCAGASTANICNGAGTGTNPTQCTGSTPFCGSNGCVACRGTVSDCADDNNQCTTDTCSAAGACNHTPIAGCTTCTGTASTCRAGQLSRCVGGLLQPPNSCAFGCNPAGTACNVCTPGRRGCVGNGRQQQVCRADGSGFDNLALCVAPSATFPGGLAALCDGPAANGDVAFFSNPCDDFNTCTTDTCSATGINGCTFTPVGLVGCACSAATPCRVFGSACFNGRCSVPIQ